MRDHLARSKSQYAVAIASRVQKPGPISGEFVVEYFPAMPDILALLIEERDKLDRAIAFLQGPKRRGRPPRSTPKKAAKKKRDRPPMTAAQREAVSKRMKKIWAKRRKAKKKS